MSFVPAVSDLAEVAIARLGGPAIAPPLDRRRMHDDGAQKLRLAILMGAVHDYRVPRFRAKAVAWIASDACATPFDFNLIAESFGYSPRWMRRRVLRLLRCIDEGTAGRHKRRPAGTIRRRRHPRPAREHRCG